jgi:hypothetical protein
VTGKKQTTASDPQIGSASGTKQDFMPYTFTDPKVTTTLACEANRNPCFTGKTASLSTPSKISFKGTGNIQRDAK